MKTIARAVRSQAITSCRAQASRALASKNFAVSPATSGLPHYQHGVHRSQSEQYIKETKVIVVDAHVAICDGGSGALGHPVEYIQLDTVSNEPAVCKYCGLKFVMGHVHLH